MKSLSLTKQFIVGFFLSLFASIGIHSLSLLFNFNHAFNLGLLITTILYIGFILNNSQLKTGRVVIFIAAVIGAIFLGLFDVSSELTLASSLLSVFLVRIIYYQTIRNQNLYKQIRLVGIAYDAALICLGLFIASGVLVSTNSWFLGFWCFFFVQSFIVYTDDFFSVKKKQAIKLNRQQKTNQKFNTAKNIANQAIQQLSTHSLSRH